MMNSSEPIMENKTRNTIFIGHAAPEDNDFTLWLYYKLKNEGYRVECDLSYLLGGESDYWDRLQQILEHETCKYILVLTQTAFTKEGVLDEWEQCKSIARKNNLKDFRLPLRLDNVSYDIRIGLNRINIIDFNNSWATGLKKLLQKLHADDVPKTEKTAISLNLWYRNKFTTFSGIKRKEEKFYSNWLELNKLPELIYFYQFADHMQARTILNENSSYPVFQLDNYLITFCKELNLLQDTSHMLFADLAKPQRTFSFETEKALTKYESDDFPKFKELQNFVKRLLKEAIHNTLAKKELRFHLLSRGRKCFYYVKDQLPKDKIFFDYEGKRTWKLMLGEYRGVNWHYGLSFQASVYPFVGYILKAHILFSDDGQQIWADDRKMHRYRRGKGANMFNQHWRNQMLGFLNAIAEDNGEIEIAFNPEGSFKIKAATTLFYSEVGYRDPKDNARLIPLDSFDDLLEETDETDDAELDRHETK